MRVVINGLAALKPKTGVGHHVAQVASHLMAAYPDDQFALYPGDRLGQLISRFVHGEQKSKPAKAAAPRKPSRVKSSFKGAAKSFGKFASSAHFMGYVRTFGFDLYHEPNFVPYRCELPTVVTVHDLSVVRHPEWHPIDRVRFHDRYFARGLERSSHVIVVSEAVRQEVIEEFGIAPHRVSTTYNGVSEAFRVHSPQEIATARRRMNLPDRFFLCVGTIEPRKNIGTVLRAFADLPASVRESCPLLLAGPWGWKADADRTLFEDIARPLGARHLGYVPDADLPALYAAATALVYPSHYEGFGIPPVEMLASGGAVLASTATAIREVVSSHGWFVAPDDLTGWRDSMLRVVNEPEFLDELRRGGPEHARRFTWEQAARDTHAVYRSVLGLSLPKPIPSISTAA